MTSDILILNPTLPTDLELAIIEQKLFVLTQIQKAQENGEKDSEQAWKGYINALNWVNAKIRQLETLTPPANPSIPTNQ